MSIKNISLAVPHLNSGKKFRQARRKQKMKKKRNIYFENFFLN